MHALILAAGTGSRLQLDVPKCLVEVGGRPMLEHQLEALDHVGADKVTLVVGHQHEQVADLADGRAEVVLNDRYGETNSLYSFWLAREAAEGDDLLVLNSDVLFAPGLLDRLLESEESALAYDSSSGDEDEHMKVRTRHGRLMRMSKDLPAEYSHGENLGVVHLNRAASTAAFAAAEALLGRGRENDWVGAAFTEVAHRYWISCVDVAGQPWVEIDFPADLELARTETWPAINALGWRQPTDAGAPSWSYDPAEASEVAT